MASNLPDVGLNAVIDNLSKFLKGADSIADAYDDIDDAADDVETSTGLAQGAISGMGKVASTVATGGLDLLVGAVVAIGVAAAGSIIALGKLGQASFELSSDIDKSQKDIQAQLGLTEEESEKLGEIATKVWANNFAGSVDEATEALITVRQQLKGISDEELQDATENAIRLSDAFGVDIVESTNAANVLMTKFGLSQQEAFDFITKGFQEGLNSSNDFLDSVSEYGNLFGQGGADAGQFFSLLETGLQGGVLGTDKAADAFKEFSVRILDGSTATDDALKSLFGFSGELTDNTKKIEIANSKLAKYGNQLSLAQLRQGELTSKTKESTRVANQQRIEEITQKIQTQKEALGLLTQSQGQYSDSIQGVIDFEGGMLGFLAAIKSGQLSQIEAFDIINKGIATFDNESTRMQTGVGLLGTQFEDMGAEAVAAIDLSTTKLEDMIGATDKLNAQYETLPQVFEGVKRQLLIAIRPVGDSLLNVGQKVMPLLLDAIEEIKPSLEEFAVVIGDFVQQAIEDLIPWIQDTLVPALIEFGNWIQEKGLPLLLQFKDFIVTSVIPTLRDFADWFVKEGLPVLLELGQTIINDIIPILVKLSEWFIKEGLPALITFSKFIVSDVIPIVQDLWNLFVRASEIFDEVKSVINDTITGEFTLLIATVLKITTAVETAWNAILSVTKDVFGNISTTIIETLTGIKDKATKAAFDIGGNIVQSLIDGIASVKDQLVTKMREISKLVEETIKEALKITSPSKVMMSIGKDISQGMAAGITQGTPLVAAATGGLVSAPVTGTIPGSSVSSTTTNNNTFNTGGNTLASNMDAVQFEAKVLQVIRNNL